MSNDIAISYDRFSDPHQGEGDSENRQQLAFASFIERHQLQPAKEYSFIDRGMSGYSGKHRDKGELGRLLEIAQTGVFKPRRGQPSYVLVVEAWDRLGRLRPDKQIDLIARLLRAGLRIGICRLDDIFTERDFGTHKWTTLAVFVQLAHQESQQKSERIGHSWKSRKQRARDSGEIVTTLVPGWLRVVNGALVPIPERVAVVKRIFHLAGSGYGIKRILRVLAEEGVPPFGRSKRWSGTYIRKILTSGQVLGRFQPERFEEQADGSRKRVLDGPPIEDYYPQVITQAEYDLARLGAGQRKGRSGPRQRRFINLFQGLLQNAMREDDSFLLVNKGTAVKPVLYLINDAGHNSGHEQVRFSYLIFERAVLRLLREVPTSVLAPSEPAPARDVLQARHDSLLADIEGLKADIRKKYSPTLSALVIEKELEYEAVKDELDRALTEQLHPLVDSWKETGDLIQAIENAPDNEAAKLRLRAAFRRCIAGMTLLILRRGIDSCCFLTMHFKSGTNRLYVIWLHPQHQCGKSVRDGFWWACSSITRHDMDLRSLEDQQFAADFVANWQEPQDVADVASLHFIRETIPAR